MATRVIYVQLLDEGTIVYRPTLAEELGADTFRVLATDNYDPEDEVWEFLPGAVVRCRPEELYREDKPEHVLVASERVEQQ